MLTIVAIVLIVGCNRHDKHMSDEALLTAFLKHQADFEQLRRRATADKKLLRVDAYRTDPPDPASAECRRSVSRSIEGCFTEWDVPKA